jgi:hypothetical protein
MINDESYYLHEIKIYKQNYICNTDLLNMDCSQSLKFKKHGRSYSKQF